MEVFHEIMAMPWPSCTMEVEHGASPWKNRSLLRQSRCTVQLGGGVGANFTVKPSQTMYILYISILSLVLKRSVNLMGTSSCKASFRVFVSSCLLFDIFCFASCLRPDQLGSGAKERHIGLQVRRNTARPARHTRPVSPNGEIQRV